MPILWKEEMSIGHEGIDNEHKYMFCLVNSVELALKLEDGQKLMEMFLDQLMEYSQQHFDHEEKLQVQHRYPHYKEHKREHQAIIAQLVKIKEQLKTAPPSSPSVDISTLDNDDDFEVEDYDPYAVEETNSGEQASQEELIKLLRHWVLDHVMVSDMKLKPYFS